MITHIRTNSGNKDFQKLVAALDRDLAIRDGEDHAFFAQYNKITQINHVVVAMDGAAPVGCGALKEYEPGVMEVKRMYVPPAQRKRGIATHVLGELERWAGEMGYARCILETGLAQPEAIGLYKKNGYTLIPNYGQYAGVEKSVCFEKKLR